MDALYELPVQVKKHPMSLLEIGPVCINGAPDSLSSVASGNEEIARVLDAYLAEHKTPGYERLELVSAVIVPVNNEACHSLRVLDARRCCLHPELSYLSMPYAAALAVSIENEPGLVEEIQTQLRLHALFFARAPHQDHVPILQVGPSGSAGVYRWGMGGDPCGPIGLVYLGSAVCVNDLTSTD